MIPASVLKKTALLGAAFGASLALAQPSAASTLLDFTDSDTITEVDSFGGGSAFGTTYSVSSTGGDVTTNIPFDGVICPAPLACDGDGLGVSGAISDDEITGALLIGSFESLTVTFDQAVDLAAFYLLDLFVGLTPERASYSINGGPAMTVIADPAGEDSGGFLRVTLGNQSVSSITFTAPGVLGDDLLNDFALAAIQAVPLPPALLLLLSSIGGLAFLARRRTVI